MKAETKNIPLKLAYLTALGSLYNAAAILLKCAALDGLIAPFEPVSVIVGIFCGYAAAMLISRVIKNRKAFAIIAVSGFFPAVAVVLAYSAYGIFRITVEIVLVETVYFTGARAYYKSYAEVAAPRWTMPAIIATVIGLVFAIVRDSSSYAVLKPVIFFYIYIFVILSVILENQKNIDYLITEMAVQTPKLPLHIRRFNLLVMLIACLAITLVAFAGPIVGGARVAFRGLGHSVRIFLVRIFKLVFSARGKPAKNPATPRTGNSIHIELLEDQSIDERIVIAVLSVLGLAIIIVIIKKLPQVFREVKRSLARLISIIKAKLALLNREKFGASVFNDEVEFSKAVFVDEILSCSTNKNRVKRNFPHRNPAMQVRYFYAVVLDLLKAAQIKLLRSDTTGEIYKKARHLDGVDEPLEQLTEIYNKVRYGDHFPDPEEAEKAGKSYMLIKSALSSGAVKRKTQGKRKAD